MNAVREDRGLDLRAHPPVGVDHVSRRQRRLGPSARRVDPDVVIGVLAALASLGFAVWSLSDPARDEAGPERADPSSRQHRRSHFRSACRSSCRRRP
jgi:hypothetical protein